MCGWHKARAAKKRMIVSGVSLACEEKRGNESERSVVACCVDSAIKRVSEPLGELRSRLAQPAFNTLQFSSLFNL